MTTLVTLYKPDSDVPEEHTVIECDVKDGVLSFVIQKGSSIQQRPFQQGVVLGSYVSAVPGVGVCRPTVHDALCQVVRVFQTIFKSWHG